MFFINTTKLFAKRFDMSKFMEYTDNAHDILNSYVVSQIKKLSEQGKYTITVEERRLDLVSFNIYGDTQYWWILMLYNSIFDTSDVVSGIIIKYPSLRDLEDLFFSLKSLDATA